MREVQRILAQCDEARRVKTLGLRLWKVLPRIQPITLEQLGGEAADPVLRHSELELADARHKGAAIVTRR